MFPPKGFKAVEGVSETTPTFTTMFEDEEATGIRP